MAVIEHTSKEFAVRVPKNDVLIMANHFIDNKLKKEDKLCLTFTLNTTKLRYEEVNQKLNVAKEDFE